MSYQQRRARRKVWVIYNAHGDVRIAYDRQSDARAEADDDETVVRYHIWSFNRRIYVGRKEQA